MTNAAATAIYPLSSRLKGWALIARIPFLSVGILPYWLGARMASHAGVAVKPAVFWLGLAGVVLTMLATYFNGEHHDTVEDKVSGELGRSKFAGGSGAVLDGLIPAHHPRVAANGAALLAGAAGLVLALVFRTGPWTVPLGAFGLLCGYFYSARPLRWVERGIGEIMIGICYGWLPVAAGYYLQAGELPPLLFWVSLPVAFSIFNVIFVNEYPDHAGDLAANKRNLLVRVGERAGVFIYIAATAAGWIAFLFSLTRGVLGWVLPWYLGVAALSLVPCVMLAAGLWRKRPLLEPICGITIVVNLATTAVYLAAFSGRG